MLFPSHAVAARCVHFFRQQAPQLTPRQVRILDLVPNPQKERTGDAKRASPKVSAVLFPREHFKIAKTFWQHAGDGVSSRRAEYIHKAFSEGGLVEISTAEEHERMCKGPRRYQKRVSVDRTGASPVTNGHAHPDTASNGVANGQDHNQFVEERFGRNLEISFAASAKLAIRRRIAGSLAADVELTEGLEMGPDDGHTPGVARFSEDDVYLYPTGMSAIFNTHRSMMAARGQMKSICYGYVLRCTAVGGWLTTPQLHLR